MLSVSDPESDSEHAISSQPSPAGSESESESDSLDNVASRKRRRLSSDSTSRGDLLSLSVNVPSRVKPRTATAQAPKAVPTPVTVVETRVAVPGNVSSSFKDLSLKPWLTQSLKNMAIHRPTRIQQLTIPAILEGRNVIGSSRTGSGKTVAFMAPILQLWSEDPSSIYAVVLTATRELALQIQQQVKAIGAVRSLKTLLVTGGEDMRQQAIELAQRPHIVIATPGRLADHIKSSGEDTVAGLKRTKFVVLDEADRILAANGPGSMLPDLEVVLGVLPPSTQRQTLLYTATITPEVRALKDMPAKPGKKGAYVCEVDIDKLAVPDTLRQMYLQVNVTHKEYYLHAFLLTDANLEKSLIIFCNRASTAQYLHHLLRLLDHRVTSLHSKLPQRERTSNMERFRAKAARILVATDVASRGLDIPEVSLVVNYDIPQEAVDYIHRVGRTARAGRRGDCVSFVGQRDVERIHNIEERVGGKEMEEWREEGVNLETRFIRDHMKVVSEKKREALLNIEEHREVGGKRKKTKLRLQ
ncbi:P-loop containing nucleoside triphosphate hydrolase protein [Ustulina deusta]|nr:P-loop containing nucleoside triphosphate hydrolase protein [Ustulina deusta]KAI3343662.1 P-loop containing nucleoside triphosphate hydrolase protein [Ustulina deusta]